MSHESDDTLDERLDRLVRRADNFRELLKDGEEVTIAFQDGELHVEESYRSKFERKHAKLFGRMLGIEAQMNAGYFPHFAALLVVGVFIFGLHLRWWESALGEEACAQLQSWWFYVGASLVVLYLVHLACMRWKASVYRRNRPALLELIAVAELDRDVLLVMLRDEGELDNVLYQLKLDPAPLQAPG